MSIRKEEHLCFLLVNGYGVKHSRNWVRWNTPDITVSFFNFFDEFNKGFVSITSKRYDEIEKKRREAIDQKAIGL